MVETCPHCGTISHTELFRSKIRQRIYDYIRTHPGALREEIISYVYAEDPNGGPESVNIISVFVNKMNKQLALKNLHIKGYQGSQGGYKLISLETP